MTDASRGNLVPPRTGKPAGGKSLTSAQRIEAATSRSTQVTITEMQAIDAEALFHKFDTEGTELLSRGVLTELLRHVGLEKALGDAFRPSAQLAFDAHSADSHFLSLPEFKQLYYRISSRHPELLPRQPNLKITIMGARGLPPADTNGKSDPYCAFQVQGKPRSQGRTRHVDKTLDPWWGEEFDDKYGYEDGDSLIFEIFDYDKGSKGELLCRGTLASKEFHRAGGFDGKLMMQDCTGQKGYAPSLKVRVTVNGLPEPPPALKIFIIGAKGLPPADTNGKSDPYCTCQLVGKQYSKSQTKVKSRTLEPRWEEEFNDKHRYDEGDGLVFEVFDYDKTGRHDLLGRATLENSLFHIPGGFDGSLNLIDVSLPGYRPTLQVKVSVNYLEEQEREKEKEREKERADGEAMELPQKLPVTKDAVSSPLPGAEVVDELAPPNAAGPAPAEIPSPAVPTEAM
mmetsp:Transcript_6311/g.13812  ORF Transcript_6311/g.13812 Transcript_6311/m.13812 type:complete len:455 (+) Transcript_6311:69-1433(+)